MTPIAFAVKAPVLACLARKGAAVLGRAVSWRAPVQRRSITVVQASAPVEQETK